MDIENNCDFLEVVSPLTAKKSKGFWTYLCRCVFCNEYSYVDKYTLSKGITNSCHCIFEMRPPHKDRTGTFVNSALIFGYTSRGMFRAFHPRCGHWTETKIADLRKRKDGSICQRCMKAEMCIETKTTHGKSKGDLTYSSWLSMKERCLNPTSGNYSRYGAKGIDVCARWRDSFENFLEDMGERKCGSSLERIDGDLGYSPDNCRWANLEEQSFNRTNTWKFKIRGEWLSMKAACRKLGLDYKRTHYAIKTSGKDPREVMGGCVEDIYGPYQKYDKIKREYVDGHNTRL